MATGAAVGAAAGGTAGAAGGFNEASNNYLTATDLRNRQQKIDDCRARKNPACEVDVLRAYDLRSAVNTGELKGSSLIEKMGLENVRAGLEQLLSDPTANEETKAQARKSIKEINTAINVIDKAPVIKDALQLGLMAADIYTLGELSAARLLTASIVKETVLARTGQSLSDDAAERIAGNFYADAGAGAAAKNPLLVDSIPRNGNRTVLDQGMVPTCGHNSCGMVLDTLGKSVDVAKLIESIPPTPQGILSKQVESLMKAEGVDAVALSSRNVDDLARYTADGVPVVVRIFDKVGGTDFSHFVVVDGVTTRNGVRVVAIRDPQGTQYFSPASTFQTNFTGEVILPKPKKP
ncbi:Peptidase C39 family [Variovorax sp. CF313]|uniref:cysteine peptidase family C39 domain-containing protein n=1 Tax=Variovorax sp. CF313 TaxID=1144315 RepID=UPI000270EC1A|nr:cysteine peptidase family C39 domain-containing protein [Variovorax sp. CF313]EJL72293.1 Peptidase C39 family [Variovorax sp. CF313]